MKPYGSKPMDAFEDPTIRKNGYYNGQCNDGSIQAKATNRRRKRRARRWNKEAIEEQMSEYQKEVF